MGELGRLGDAGEVMKGEDEGDVVMMLAILLESSCLQLKN